MRILIVYDSFYGNTKLVADAIGDSFDEEEVEVLNVIDVDIKSLKKIDLLIVGSPTRQFKPTDYIEDFLNNIPSNYLNGIKVMAFDTRLSKVEMMSGILKLFAKKFEYAAEPIGNKLVSKGGKLICNPEGFFVKSNKGPLHEGEIERASAWAENAVDDSI
ncbi:MAG: flavodoxin [Bacillota bacterium]|nr:flavodoxin [Bacillota bacterium]